MNLSEPYRDIKQPGRLDVNGVEWWACDPYPTWFRWEGNTLRQDHGQWVPNDPKMAVRKAERFEKAAQYHENEAKKLREQAHNLRTLSQQ